MKRVRITGTIRYDFRHLILYLPDSIDIEDKDAVSDFFEGYLAFECIKQHATGEIGCEIDEIEETP